jgi:regulator of sigma E protease
MMTILYALILLGILIFVHELGHFLFAKLANVKVLKFSLGFGPKVLGRKYGETEYLISAVPLGGYVKMLGEESDDEISAEDRTRAYNAQPVGKRMLIVLSGPVFNILFAAFVFTLISVSGIPVPYPDIGKVSENSPASRAGLMTGDRVVAIDGSAVKSWDEIEASISKKQAKALLFTVKRAEELKELSVTPEKKSEKDLFGENREVWNIGISPLLYPDVGEVTKGSPAEKAGLQRGDRIVEIGGTALKTWQDMTTIIHENPGKPLSFRIQRGARSTDVTIIPEKSSFAGAGGEKKEIGLIGVRPLGNDFIKRYGPVEAIRFGAMRTWDVSVLTVVSIVKLIQRVIPAETIGGPILIFQMAGQQAAHGPLSFFTFLAVISINLGVLNLLPIPMLDGGHMFFLCIEAVRKKPVSEKVIMIAQRAGLAFIVTLMVFAFYNDIMRLITGKMIP